MQSVPITTDVVSSILNQGEVCNSMSVVFSVSPVFFTNKTDYHDITDILLKVMLNTITLMIFFYQREASASNIMYI